MSDQKPQPPRTETPSITTRGWWRVTGPPGEIAKASKQRLHPTRRTVRRKRLSKLFDAVREADYEHWTDYE